MTQRSTPGTDSHYARLRREHRDRKRSEGGSDPQALPEGRVHLYGLHAVEAALANPRRTVHVLHVTANARGRLDPAVLQRAGLDVREATPRQIDELVGGDAVHQGACLEADALPAWTLEQLDGAPLLVVLDQVTDPHNVGAVMRSAVALGAGALITTARHSPRESGVLAKAASGALEHIRLVHVRNLANALGELNNRGYTTIGLDSEGPDILEKTVAARPMALVLGAEGKGLRQKTRETVTHLARLDMPGPIASLNVSNAAVLALYVARGAQRAD